MSSNFSEAAPSPGQPCRVLVTGATSQVGPFLLARLTAVGYRVHAVSRRCAPPECATCAGVQWHSADLHAGGAELPAVTAQAAIHLAPLWVLPDLIPALRARGVQRLIAFGSTSRFVKATSGDPGEHAVAQALTRAEAEVRAACDASAVRWTIFRPTLIYGGGADRNVSEIARFISRFGFFPLVAGGRGLRQPVHADDLAGACVAALECGASFGCAYNLSGGETLSYRQMVERVFVAAGRRPRLIPLPLGLCRLGIRLLAIFPRYRFLTPDMADRMSQDLCFEHEAAARDFGFAPRSFCLRGSATGPPGRC